MKRKYHRIGSFLSIMVLIFMCGLRPADAHVYYGNNITEEQIAEADAMAHNIADYIISKNFGTDIEKVGAATVIVREFALNCKYGPDENKYYRTPYGVLISGNATCAGTTRTLGRVLEFLGYEWEHVNENEWLHQWCVLTMDGKRGYADPGLPGKDGYGAFGYGIHEEGEECVRKALEMKAKKQQAQ